MRPRRPARAGREWSVEEAATFSALRAFKLAELLASADRRVMAAARRLHAPYGAVEAAPVPAPRPPPAAGAAGGDAAGQKKRKPRKVSEARRAILEARPRAQAHRQKRMHAKLLEVLPLVNKVMRAAAATAKAIATPMDADATSAGANIAPSSEAAATMPPPPLPVPPPSPPPQWSPSWAAVGSSSASPLTPKERGARDREPSQDRSRSPSDVSPGSDNGGVPAPRDAG